MVMARTALTVSLAAKDIGQRNQLELLVVLVLIVVSVRMQDSHLDWE